MVLLASAFVIFAFLVFELPRRHRPVLSFSLNAPGLKCPHGMPPLLETSLKQRWSCFPKECQNQSSGLLKPFLSRRSPPPPLKPQKSL